MRKRLFAALTLIAACVAPALAQQPNRLYEADGFYIIVTPRTSIRIGTTDGAQLATPNGKKKMEVDVYSAADLPEGYSHAKEIADPDFYINDNFTEMMTEDSGEARELARCCYYADNDIKLKIDIQQADGTTKAVFFTLPKYVCKQLYSTFRKR